MDEHPATSYEKGSVSSSDCICLRPNNAKMPFMFFNNKSSDSSKATGTMGGRKRHLSTNDEIAQQEHVSHDSVEQNEKAFHSPRCHSIPSRKLGAKREIQTCRYLLTSDELNAAEALAESHCNKLFTLKGSTYDRTQDAIVADDDIFVLPSAATLFTEPEWKVDDLQDHKRHLNLVKGHAERGEDMSSWTDHTFHVNPAAAVFARVRQHARPEFMSQAFLKFYEVLCHFPALCSNTSSLTSVHLCEAPGAFIIALNHYLRVHYPETQWEWVGNTLHPYYEGSTASECIPDDRIILHTLPHWVFGENGTGNITERSCLEELKTRTAALPYPVSLVTADGSIDCQSDPGEQEAMTSHLHLCEVLAGLELLSKGGSLVVKMFTFFEARSISLLYLLCCIFRKVHVFKPITSKLGNSEVYVVCLEYSGREGFSEHMDRLLEAYTPKPLTSPMFALSDLPTKFVQLVTVCAQFFMEHQVDAINRNVQLYMNVSELERASCEHVQELVWRRFAERNKPLRPIESDEGVLMGDVRWDQNVHPTFSKHKKWTGCLARYDLEKKFNFVDEQLKYLMEQYACREDTSFRFCGDIKLLNCMKVTKGIPFRYIGTSRFCFDKILNLYLTYIKLKESITTEEIRGTNHEAIRNSVVYLRSDDKDEISDGDENGEQYPYHDKDTSDLLQSVRKDYPACNFVVQSYPSHNHPPASSCEALEFLYNLMKTNALAEGTTIYLVNIPLLTRLQNGLFVILSSCFKRIILHQSLGYQLHTGILAPPVIVLDCLSTCRAHAAMDRLRDVGWLPGAHNEGIMEVLDTSSLIQSGSHALVCRYNASLVAVWTAAVARQAAAARVVK